MWGVWKTIYGKDKGWAYTELTQDQAEFIAYENNKANNYRGWVYAVRKFLPSVGT
jgi:hypothetical protein